MVSKMGIMIKMKTGLSACKTINNNNGKNTMYHSLD